MRLHPLALTWTQPRPGWPVGPTDADRSGGNDSLGAYCPVAVACITGEAFGILLADPPMLLVEACGVAFAQTASNKAREEEKKKKTNVYLFMSASRWQHCFVRASS